MNRKYFIFIVSMIIIGCTNNKGNNILIDFYSDNNFDTYYCVVALDNFNNNVVGIIKKELRVSLDIKKINNDLDIIIRKEIIEYGDMTFVETIVLVAKARKIDSTYEFKCSDSWNNKVFGNIIFNDNETITLFFDCNKYSKNGIIVKGLYGEKHILIKGNIDNY